MELSKENHLFLTSIAREMNKEDAECLPEELAKVINSQKDPGILKQWIKFAAKTDSIEEFEELIGLVK